MTRQYNNYEDMITFTRASTGTALRPVSYGDELVTNGTFDTDTTGWTADTDTTISAVNGAMRVELSGGVSNPSAYTSVSTEAGKVYKYQAQITGGTQSGWRYLRVGTSPLGSDIAEYIEKSDGVSLEVNFVATGTTIYVTVLHITSTIGQYLDYDNISVKEVTFDQPDGTLTLFNHPTNVPRIEYDADGNWKGLLIEEARTNLASSEISNWTYSIETSAVSEASSDPAGTNQATLLIPSTTDSVHSYGWSQSYSSGAATETFSVYAKADTHSQLFLFLANQVGGYIAKYDLVAETAVNKGSALDQNIQAIGNGWYRCSLTYLATKANPYPSIRISNGGEFNDTFEGDGTTGLYVWGAQIEVGAFPTSYIPTSGATATRSADVASMSVSDFGYNQKAGTVVVDVETFDTDYSNWVWILDGTSDASLYGHSAANGWRLFGAGGTIAYLGSLPANADAKIGYAYNNAGSAALLDGGAVVAANHSQPVAVTTMRLGAASASSAFLNGHIKSIQYYPRRLSNAQLQALTS